MQAFTLVHNTVQSTVKSINALRLKHTKEWVVITITLTNTQHIVLKSYNTWIQHIEYRNNWEVTKQDSSNMGISIKEYKEFLTNYILTLES